jgi:hypothetical protein
MYPHSKGFSRNAPAPLDHCSARVIGNIISLREIVRRRPSRAFPPGRVRHIRDGGALACSEPRLAGYPHPQDRNRDFKVAVALPIAPAAEKTLRADERDKSGLQAIDFTDGEK